MKLKLYCYVMVCLFLLEGCENCSDTADERVTSFIDMEFVDNNGDNLIDAVKGPYHPDSIKAFTENNDSFSFKKWTDPVLKHVQLELLPPFNDTGETVVYLYLNHLDTDTLVINYSHHKNKCSDYYEYTNYRFNGKEVKINYMEHSVLKLLKKRK